MIQPNELRIGNLVMNATDNQTRSVKDWRIDSISRFKAVCIRPNDRQEVFKLSILEGIPLTSEWLWKFGFQPNPREQRLYIQISEDGWIHYYPGTNEILLATECGYSQFGTRNKIEYVHQLQNLYHSLTAEELTIKDDGKKEGKEQQESGRAESPATDSLE